MIIHPLIWDFLYKMFVYIKRRFGLTLEGLLILIVYKDDAAITASFP